MARHPKTQKLAEILGVDRYAAVGHLVALWAYALEMRDDGILTPDEVIGAFDYTGALSDEEVLQALRRCGSPRAGFIDECQLLDNETGEPVLCYALHGWTEYSGVLQKKREEKKKKEKTPPGQLALPSSAGAVAPPQAGPPIPRRKERSPQDVEAAAAMIAALQEKIAARMTGTK